MCPPTPASLIIIGLLADEALILLLDEIIHGYPLPSNVIADLNPYSYLPSNLPDGVLYFINSEFKKNTELGTWKTKGEPRKIFTNSVITGWRTTLEFYEGQARYERRTGWVMQEYTITHTLLSNSNDTKDSGSLCRLFHSEEHNTDHVMSSTKHGVALPKADSTIGRGSTSEAQAQEKNGDNETGQLTVAENNKNGDNETGQLTVAENNCVLTGDYLELNDLAYPKSPGDYMELNDLASPISLSSSSDNSTRPSFTSEECFDSLAVLQDLEDENTEREVKDASFKYSVCAPAKLNEVTMLPTTIGEGIQKYKYSLPKSAIQGNIDKRVVDHRAVKFGQANEVASSSSHQKAVVKEKKRKDDADGRMKKLKKKYFCFMPF